jgi:hypothetical protein
MASSADFADIVNRFTTPHRVSDVGIVIWGLLVKIVFIAGLGNTPVAWLGTLDFTPGSATDPTVPEVFQGEFTLGPPGQPNRGPASVKVSANALHVTLEVENRGTGNFKSDVRKYSVKAWSLLR